MLCSSHCVITVSIFAVNLAYCNYSKSLYSLFTVVNFFYRIQKQLERAMDGPIDVIRFKQQQENLKFLSHFGGKFIIHRVSCAKSEVCEHDVCSV